LLASENFPASVLALDGRVDVAFHAPAACMDDVLGQMLGEVEYDEDIPHLISPAVLQRREARLQGPGSLAVVREVRDRRARRGVGKCILKETLRN
jgi:hypothetical protein